MRRTILLPSTNAPSGTTLTFSIANKPDWATFSAPHRRTDRDADPGRHVRNILISVSDGTQTSALDAFAISVAAPIRPTIRPSYPEQPGHVGARRHCLHLYPRGL